MKKNLISIVILALLIVNIVLSAITLFSVAGTNKKTAALVTDIASAIQLDLGISDESGEAEETVSMADVEPYDIEEMTIPLKRDDSENGDGKDHFALISITLSMNTKDKGYKNYGADMDTRVSLIKGEINDVVSQYTLDEARGNNHEIEEKILQRIQDMFDSKFIYKVTISSVIYQ